MGVPQAPRPGRPGADRDRGVGGHALRRRAAAEALGLNVVVLITAAALVVSATRVDPRTGEARTSSEARVTGVAFWEQASLMISSLLYLLIGRALPDAVRALGERPVWQVAACVVALLALLVALKYAAALAAGALPPAAGTLRRRGGAADRLAAAGVMAWACTRSPIGLVIALSIPAALPDGRPFPDRDLILVTTALLVVGSTLVQGLTLRFAVRGADLGGEAEEEREHRTAEDAMEAARPSAAEGAPDHEGQLAAERKALLDLRERDRIGDEVLDEKMRKTDLRERVTEEKAMPGAGPPNP